jgi:hypothetical protein
MVLAVKLSVRQRSTMRLAIAGIVGRVEQLEMRAFSDSSMREPLTRDQSLSIEMDGRSQKT